MLEAVKVANPTIPASVLVPPMDWERFVVLLASDVLREQSPKALLVARARLYELLVNCVPADAIVRRLTTAIVADLGKGLPDAVKGEVAHWAAHYEHRLQLGQKELFQLEALVAKLMYVLKRAGCQPLPSGMGAGGSA